MSSKICKRSCKKRVASDSIQFLKIQQRTSLKHKTCIRTQQSSINVVHGNNSPYKCIFTPKYTKYIKKRTASNNIFVEIRPNFLPRPARSQQMFLILNLQLVSKPPMHFLLDESSMLLVQAIRIHIQILNYETTHLQDTKRP